MSRRIVLDELDDVVDRVRAVFTWRDGDSSDHGCRIGPSLGVGRCGAHCHPTAFLQNDVVQVVWEKTSLQ